MPAPAPRDPDLARDLGLDLATLRRYAIARSLGAPTSLARAVERMGFVQADPIRAPARAQDLTLRHRVEGYRAGDLEQRYGELAIEEDMFVNYGFLPRVRSLAMLPRAPRHPWDRTTKRRAALVLAFVRERGEAHPREVDRRFAHGSVTNYWGGSSSATTHLLELLHYRGDLRVARREAGVRVYAPRSIPDAERGDPDALADALLDLAFRLYAPLPARSLGPLASRLRYAAPALAEAGSLRAAVARARARAARARIGDVEWLWPGDEDPRALGREDAVEDRVRFVAPFDPVVWDRARFEAFWGWDYRFEAYTPVAKRRFGYYALPVLWRDAVIGWVNVAGARHDLAVEPGWVAGRAPRPRAFAREFEREVERMRAFLATG